MIFYQPFFIFKYIKYNLRIEVNTFYTHIQPNIIKFSDNEDLPENLRCRYAINYNVWGIDYFFENYLLQESNDGVYMILNENGFNFILEDSLSDQNTLDIPRLYILITEQFLNDTSKFQEFILRSSKDNEVYFSGIDGFRPGTDYFINTTLFNYLTNINAITVEEGIDPASYKLPNYIDENGKLTKYFVDLSTEIIKDYTNLNYFDSKNKLLENHFSEDELNNFYQGIANIIITYSSIQENPIIFNKAKNQIYDKVLNYYANSQIDDASIALSLILGSSYNTVSTTQTCGCMNEVGNSTYVTDSCSSLYTNAMALYLKQMFGDPEFYEDWFCIYLSEEEKFPNDVLIETLELFIKEFISIDYNLDFSYNHQTFYNCECTDNNKLNNSSLEYKKLNNFLQILDWINNNELDINVNKIKIYGEAFGELLPKLQF